MTAVTQYYSKESLAETKEFLMRLWNMEELPRPAYFLSLMVAGDTKIPPEELLVDHKIALEAQFEAMHKHARYVDDNVPALVPGFGNATIPSAFGSTVTRNERGVPWSAPVIKKPSDVYDLPRPKVGDGLTKNVIERIEAFVKLAEGAYPIRAADLQSPLDCGSIMWDYTDYVLKMYEAPDEIHHLLTLLTDFTIDFIKAQRDASPEFNPISWPHAWLPEGMGVGFSDDLVAILSPPLYEKFGLPYMNRISEEFNGITIHSCGCFTHNIQNLLKIHKLRGINFGANESPLEPLVDAFSGKAVLMPHMGTHGRTQRYRTMAEFVEHALSLRKPNTNYYLQIQHEVEVDAKLTPQNIDDVIAVLKSYNALKG